jgi:hypothetical protein
VAWVLENLAPLFEVDGGERGKPQANAAPTRGENARLAANAPAPDTKPTSAPTSGSIARSPGSGEVCTLGTGILVK